MKIAITGSTWFVGAHLVDFFKCEHEVTAFNRKIEKKCWNVEYILWDIQNPCPIDTYFDVFIHAAADTWYKKKKEEMFLQNVTNTKNVVDFVNTVKCGHFIYISSSSVYQGHSWILSEEMILSEGSIKNSYSLTKYLAEVSIKKRLHRNIKLSILRPRAIYGEWDRTLLPNILQHSIGRYLFMLGDGRYITSITHIYNLIQAIDIVIRKQVKYSEIFNIADSSTIKYRDIYEALLQKYHFLWIFHIPKIIINILCIFNPNTFSYLLDTFFSDKVLEIAKIQQLWYTWGYQFTDFIHQSTLWNPTQRSSHQ